jgi:16S rRNA (adenine1518-N6/adenine1519-N6)-dimethyltransferase
MSLAPINPRELLGESGLHPKKRLGQNFLADQDVLREIVQIAGVTPEDEVLEIGAGLGSLTRELAVSAQRVAAVEIDPRLLHILRKVMKPFNNVVIIEGDILKLDPENLVTIPGYLVAANIPYYITSAVIRHLLEARLKPARMVLTVQKEVAERICAAPGGMNLLALSVQVYGKPEIKRQIPAAAFFPVPEIDSAVLRIELFHSPSIPSAYLGVFFLLSKAGFSQKRKTLRNSLAGGLRLPTSRVETFLKDGGVDPQRRAETLSVAEWGRLAEIYCREIKQV